MKHEYTAILNHLRVKHNMTLTTYTQTYIRPVAVGQPSSLPISPPLPPVLIKAPAPAIAPAPSPAPSPTPASVPTALEEPDQFYIVYPEHDQK